MELNRETATLAKGYDVVCVFVNDKVDEETLKILSAQKRFGRHIFNLGHGILPDAKIENVEAMRKCVAEFK